jgi:TatD DNase family protein
MRLVDTHCHIHESSYPLDRQAVLDRARSAGVEKLICVGTDVTSSQEAAAFASQQTSVFASLGVHPHEASIAPADVASAFDPFLGVKTVAIGEIGLDYFYSHSSREQQVPLLEQQLQYAVDHNLPIIFHVRDAFDDFWPIFDNFRALKGVLHSFTDTAAMLEKALERDLFIGVNGISAFTRQPEQQAMFASIPLDRLLFETDAPYLTPPPFRGSINESAYVSLVASYHAKVRGISEDRIASTTTASAEALFGI